MDALVIGTGGARGWPEDGCRCASCMRARSAGVRRAPGRVLVDDWLEVVPGGPVLPGTGPSRAAALHIQRLPGGLDITSADGTRLLLAAGPGEVPEPQPGAGAYDLALLDLLASPAQLGRLRASGLVHHSTAVAALYTDHRVSSPAEMARRCQLWGADQAHDGQLITGPAAADRPVATARPHRTLIIGGARSGKSTEAELRLSGEPQVTYVAAGPFPPVSQDEAPHGWPEGAGQPTASPGPGWMATSPGPGRTATRTLSGPAVSPSTAPAGQPGGEPSRAWISPGSCAATTACCSSTALAPGWPRSSTKRACGPPRNRLAQLSAIRAGLTRIRPRSSSSGSTSSSLPGARPARWWWP